MSNDGAFVQWWLTVRKPPPIQSVCFCPGLLAHGEVYYVSYGARELGVCGEHLRERFAGLVHGAAARRIPVMQQIRILKLRFHVVGIIRNELQVRFLGFIRGTTMQRDERAHETPV